MSKLSKFRTLILLFASLSVVLLFAKEAQATHFRYGNITYTIPDPINAPLTVRFDVVVGWKYPYTSGLPVDCTTLNFGDGTPANPCTIGLNIGEGVDIAGEVYRVWRYSVTHTYPSQGVYEAFFSSCCRILSLSAGQSSDSFRVWTKVDLTSGNTGSAVSALPPIFQLQTGGLRTVNIPAADPDGQPVTCRFGTPAETSTDPMPPPIPGGPAPTLTTTPSGCTLQWDTTLGASNQKYALSIVLESFNGPAKSESVLDFIVEFTSSPPPTCSGGGLYTVDLGTSFMHQVVGTNIGGGNLTMTNIGPYGSINPAPGTTLPSPFTTTYSISPSIGDSGVGFMTILYTNAQNLSGFCTLVINTPQCPVFGDPCSAGVGACQGNGYKYCLNGVEECSAVAGQPTAELCDNIDNNCDGVVDDNDPETGNPCTTSFPGACADGTALCNAGTLECIPNIQPGTVTETCDGVDQDCNGVVDDGFGTGVMCIEGDGQCTAAGIIVCDGPSSTTCNADPAPPTVEKCDGKDNDCDLSIDEDFPLGMACTSGLGTCAAAGVIVCDDVGNAKCDGIPGLPGVEVCGDGLDTDCDGDPNNGCGDSDGDGLFDSEEQTSGLDPNDTDSDDDGVPDGQEPNWNQDTDGDGLINALDPDSDNDGLFDGTELGLGCDDPGTNLGAGVCVADADPTTQTDPLAPDSDMGGGSDGSEDANLDGKVDAGETSPSDGGDDDQVVDTDGDGLGDQLEVTLGTAPNDADTDDDGLLDGDEANPTTDTDGDGLTNLFDVDSDNDALFDGTEAGKDCDHPHTQNKKHCKFDGDPTTTTGVLNPDTDAGGVIDGSEDTNLNGVKGTKDTDPNDASDDGLVIDTDGDGLADELEALLNSNAMDVDSDDDGVLDGDEPNPSDDADGDGQINVMDPDSDNDGLFDGTELGLGCEHADTDTSQGFCVPDADMGMTTTNPLLADSDAGGVLDGDEDANHNGMVDAGELDPNDPSDDMPSGCMTDADCGPADSGKVCDDQSCIDGCRAEGGNGCPMGQTCSSSDDTIGQCSGGEGGSGGGGAGGSAPGGCGCRTTEGPDTGALGLLAIIGLAAVAASRRRRR